MRIDSFDSRASTHSYTPELKLSPVASLKLFGDGFLTGLHELACMPAIFSLLGLNATDHTKQPWATTGIFTGKNFWGQFLKLLAWVYQQK